MERARPPRVAQPGPAQPPPQLAGGLRVNVRASVWRASAVPVATRWAMRRVSTRVLPDPAPAMTATSVDGVVTAARWSGSRSPSSAADGAVGAGGRPARGHPTERRQYCATVPYPKKLLNDYETVALDLHPHWWYFVEAALALVVTIVLGIVVLAVDGPAWRQVRRAWS